MVEKSHTAGMSMWPGVKPADIHVEMHDNVVTVQGDKYAEREARGKNWYLSERSFGTFSRTFRLPPAVNGDDIDASVSDGVLKLHIPKPKPAARNSRKTEVKTS